MLFSFFFFTNSQTQLKINKIPKHLLCLSHFSTLLAAPLKSAEIARNHKAASYKTNSITKQRSVAAVFFLFLFFEKAKVRFLRVERRNRMNRNIWTIFNCSPLSDKINKNRNEQWDFCVFFDICISLRAKYDMYTVYCYIVYIRLCIFLLVYCIFVYICFPLPRFVSLKWTQRRLKRLIYYNDV